MKKKIENYIKGWENKCYKSGIPDEIPARLELLNKAPSYKAIVKAIMKNDNHLEGLGYTRPKTKSYNEIKRIDLVNRGKIKQLRLF